MKRLSVKPAKKKARVTRAKKILVVQDDRTTRLLLKSLLEGSGYTVICASTFVEAVAAIGAERPDLVTVDLNIDGKVGEQGQEGLSVVDWAQSFRSGRMIPLIVMSGDDQKFIMKRTQGIDMVFLLPKPIVPKELLAAV